MRIHLPPALFALALPALVAVTEPPSLAAQVQTRSSVVGSAALKLGEQGRFLFAGVGINAYGNVAGWKTLDNAVNDVESVREALITLYGFEAAPEEWVLTDDEATAQAVYALVDALRRGLRDNDNLVFFFAGHGATVRDTVGVTEIRTGYLVPVNVKGPVHEVPSQYINIQDLLEALARLPARHVLVILDSCYSGLALESSFKMRGGGETQQVRDLVTRVSRRILTSAQADQQAADGGAEHPKNSLFTGWLVSGLERAAQVAGEPPDSDGDGMVTVTDLYSFVQERVGSDTGSGQTPDFGSFELDQRGELVLTLERDPFDEYYAEVLDALERGDLERLESSAKLALDERDEGPQAAYVKYLSASAANEYGRILAALRELAALSSSGEHIPMSAGTLTLELRNAEALCRKMTCAPGGA